jgi:hypothetical protein
MTKIVPGHDTMHRMVQYPSIEPENEARGEGGAPAPADSKFK